MFDRNVCRKIDRDIETALEDVAKRYNVSITMDGGTFSPEEYKPKIALRAIDDEGNAYDPHAEDFRLMAHRYGLDPSDQGRAFEHRGRRYTLEGVRVSNRKYPILARREDGTVFKFTAPTMRLILDRSPI